MSWLAFGVRFMFALVRVSLKGRLSCKTYTFANEWDAAECMKSMNKQHYTLSIQVFNLSVGFFFSTFLLTE